MSRGPGDIQRKLLGVFEDDDGFHSTFELAAAVYDVRPDRDGFRGLSEAQLSSVRRALGKLAADGVVRGRRGYHDGRQRWATPTRWMEEDARMLNR